VGKDNGRKGTRRKVQGTRLKLAGFSKNTTVLKKAKVTRFQGARDKREGMKR